MTTTPSARPPRLRYHRFAYPFVFDALKRAQQKLDQAMTSEGDRHVTGPQLLDGFRELAYERFGGLALTVFCHWGLTTTDDVGRIVWELIERGDMKKTDQDQLTDFFGLYSFAEVFGERYPLNVSAAFQQD